MQDFIATITAFADAHRAWAPLLVLLLAFGESIAFVSLLLPFWGMLVALGALFGGSWIEFLIIWAAASVGAALGDWVSYWLGAHFKDKIAAMWPLSRYPDLLPKGQSFFDKYGAWAIVLGRFSGPFRASVPIIAGASRMNPLIFQVANWSSAFLWAFVLLVFGDFIGKIMAYLHAFM
ncbi:MAG: membrane protein DedA with SNARE-associated domain [Hyphomicrobiaceae bacterium]